MDKYEALKLKNQICFPLYSVSNLITRNYKPFLDELNLTYTQYIVMMVIWEKKEINEKELGQTLFLKSNTLASLLKKLKAKGYIDINKNMKDSRNIVITLTELGKNLKEKAVTVPYSIVKTINLSEEEALYLYKILYKILEVEKKMSYDVIYIGSGHACWHGALILKTLGIKEPSKMIFAFPTQTYGLISSLIPLFLKKKLVII